MIRGVDGATDTLTDAEYGALARFRYHLRRFLHFSEQAARAAGLEPHQHQVLLALKGLGQAGGATVGPLADWLQVRHHSAVELVDRTARRGLVERVPDPADRRRVLVRLTPAGEGVLHRLSVEHQAELRTAAPALLASLSLLLDGDGSAVTADVGPGDSARGPAPMPGDTPSGMSGDAPSGQA